MQEILIAISLGILIGWFDVLSYKTKSILNKLSSGCLLIMLACLGAKIGCDDQLLKNLDRLGLQAFSLAVSVVAGSIFMVWLVSKLFAKEVAEAENTLDMPGTATALQEEAQVETAGEVHHG